MKKFLFFVAVSTSLVQSTPQTTTLANLHTLAKNPRIKAFLDMIAYAEGTYCKGGYKFLFTHKKFDDYDDHPNTIICAISNGRKLCSSAAGRYQILKGIWDKVKNRIGVATFAPKNQNLAAVYLLAETKAADEILKGDIPKAMERARHVWASLPTSRYRQPKKETRDLLRKYKRFLASREETN